MDGQRLKEILSDYNLGDNQLVTFQGKIESGRKQLNINDMGLGFHMPEFSNGDFEVIAFIKEKNTNKPELMHELEHDDNFLSNLDEETESEQETIIDKHPQAVTEIEIMETPCKPKRYVDTRSPGDRAMDEEFLGI